MVKLLPQNFFNERDAEKKHEGSNTAEPTRNKKQYLLVSLNKAESVG